jgi:DNA topoisomerase-1
MNRSAGRAPTDCCGAVDPVTSAKVAGLRYVHDRMPGIRRVASGKLFRYVGPDGKPVRDAEALQRIRSLVIPPAWTDVWICTLANGHLQATGRDARGRKQSRYHPRWREVRDETKYGRILQFGRRLPQLRKRVARDLAKPGLPREKVLATLVRLLETTLIRVGNEEYARQNQSFGLTTMRDRHAKIHGAEVRFEFTGKSGVKHSVSIRDRRLAKLVRRCQDVPGQELFQYLDEHGNRRTVDSADVNAYLKEIAGEAFTAKDFRTWAGTVLAAAALREFEKFDSQTQAKKNVVAAIESVAKKLGNTKTICRKCYVHPVVVEAYLDGTLRENLQRRATKVLTQSLHDLTPEEAAVLAFLQTRLASRER